MELYASSTKGFGGYHKGDWFYSSWSGNLELPYDKIYAMAFLVLHTPCDLCNRDIRTKHEIESMLNSIDQTASLDKDLAGIYQNLAYSSTQNGIRLLYWVDSEKLVWLYELVRCLDKIIKLVNFGPKFVSN
ncbi:Hypothetical predicted protein [Mytilus galloprovincialis]|uniref:Uncharacterized protein n=1 Tax=Mytilus galloprovincialis TaxID=29158 RepID=A0A8B6GRV1_MYTGA|nr:Hypothetical predicted protein [Mytilus galloprovincialis]